MDSRFAKVGPVAFEHGRSKVGLDSEHSNMLWDAAVNRGSGWSCSSAMNDDGGDDDGVDNEDGCFFEGFFIQ